MNFSRKMYLILFFSLDENKFEESCQWCVELVIFKYYEESVGINLLHISKYIGIHNPLLPYTLI